jgi:hypothetical protein
MRSTNRVAQWIRRSASTFGGSPTRLLLVIPVAVVRCIAGVLAASWTIETVQVGTGPGGVGFCNSLAIDPVSAAPTIAYGEDTNDGAVCTSDGHWMGPAGRRRREERQRRGQPGLQRSHSAAGHQLWLGKPHAGRVERESMVNNLDLRFITSGTSCSALVSYCRATSGAGGPRTLKFARSAGKAP